VRDGTIPAKPRTQESVAISMNGADWFLLNASPEIRQQVEDFAPLHPRSARHSPIAAIILTNGDLDHCLGLLSLRESHPITVYATDRVRRGFTEGNVLYRTLERFEGQVTWRALKLGREAELDSPGAVGSGLLLEARAVPGKPPIHLEHLGEASPEDNVAVRIRERGTGRTLVYASAVGGITPEFLAYVAGADCLFLDGTFWSSAELIDGGLGTKRAEEMAHVPLGGPGGSLAAFSHAKIGRKVLIHVNNTNPVLREDTPERRQATEAGWEIASDGMEFLV